MTSSPSNPARMDRARRRATVRIPALAAALVVAGAGLGCGIGASVADACITKQRVYERAQRRVTSLTSAGVPTETAVYRAASQRLSRARSEYTACRAPWSADAI